MLAYIDPGTGSIILQSLIAGALGVLIFFRDAIKRAFRIVFPGKSAPAETEQQTKAAGDDASKT